MTDRISADRVLTGAERSRADNAAGEREGYRALSYVIAGPLAYGGLGWVGDHFLGTQFLLPLGLVLGLGLSVYMIIKRYGAVR
ncbi:hypothetical protein [Desertihabitans aurantiacus]|uniref:hypothetical protein n=1 Tax=Desertihabitans aurantiacus TaxID=2282477 RepID=UPI000DF804D7|nr:hypothetical protein [Desertihabitans aurantiacus]